MSVFFLLKKGGNHLKIEKILNNNVVISLDKKGQDIIVMGSGVAFQKKRGDIIDETKIERVFTQQVPELTQKFQQMFHEIPIEYLEITEKIILYAESKLEYDFNDNLYLSLLDHIHFTIQRYHQGLKIENRLLTETKMMYKEEFEVAKEAVKMLNDTFGVELPEDESAFIAFHFVNAGSASTMGETVQKARIVQDALTIIKNYFKIELKEDSIDYYRLVTHLKFFVQRMSDGTEQPPTDSDGQLLQLVKTNYKESYECVNRIAKYIQLEFGYQVSGEEKLYLTIHIQRIREINA